MLSIRRWDWPKSAAGSKFLCFLCTRKAGFIQTKNSLVDRKNLTRWREKKQAAGVELEM